MTQRAQTLRRVDLVLPQAGYPLGDRGFVAGRGWNERQLLSCRFGRSIESRE
jgi:hypothetical protein